ncbi:MAG: NOP5/NOP56 family protein [Candidatus Micrarchaeaceae archaeon]
MKETAEQKRRRLLQLAKESVAQAYSTGEHAVMQAINTYNDLEKAKNLVHERLTEWYGIYFPELRISQHAYASLVARVGKSKRQADYEALARASGMEPEELKRLANSSIGKEPEESEYNVIRQLAESELALESLQSSIDAYLKASVAKLMPNTASLIEYKLAAELLSKAGSLNKLANMPASTIQLLGAEKALFRHLKYGAKPPKYGVLFKLKDVANAQKTEKGKIARLYATKISIASRADALSGRFIGNELKQSLDEAMRRLKSKPTKRSRQ